MSTQLYASVRGFGGKGVVLFAKNLRTLAYSCGQLRTQYATIPDLGGKASLGMFSLLSQQASTKT